MTDDTSTEGRALLTETEREAIAGDRSDSYKYKTRSYLKRRIEKLESDVEVLENHAPELLADVQDAVNVADEQSQQEPTPDETGRSEQQDTTQLAQDLLTAIQKQANATDNASQQEATPDETDRSERPHTAQLSAAQTSESTDTGPVDPTDREIRDALRRHFETDAGPRRRAPREALLDLVILLRQKGPLTTADARNELYPQHEDNYSGPKTMWDSLRRHFDETPGVTQPGRGEYDFTTLSDILSECNNDQ
jgi:hypothetical protein